MQASLYLKEMNARAIKTRDVMFVAETADAKERGIVVTLTQQEKKYLIRNNGPLQIGMAS